MKVYRLHIDDDVIVGTYSSFERADAAAEALGVRSEWVVENCDNGEQSWKAECGYAIDGDVYDFLTIVESELDKTLTFDVSKQPMTELFDVVKFSHLASEHIEVQFATTVTSGDLRGDKRETSQRVSAAKRGELISELLSDGFEGNANDAGAFFSRYRNVPTTEVMESLFA
jgi:hypothetical protein